MKAEFKDGFAVDFKMAVSETFKDSLVKERFHTGDIIYNDRRAYLSPWSNAIKHVVYGFQVIQMLGEDIEYIVLRKNFNGSSLEKEKSVKEPIQDFFQHLKRGI
jgi:hypothetical protein